MSKPSQKPPSSTAGNPPPRVTSPPKTNAPKDGSLASFMGNTLGVKHTGSSSGMIKKETHDDAAERAFHANKPANEAMARNFAAMVMSSAKPVGSVGMKLPSQIIKEQQGKKPAPSDTHAAEQKVKDEEKLKKEKAERDKKEKADQELKAKAEAPKAATTSTSTSTSTATLTKVSSNSAADKAKKEKEEKEKKEREEREKKAKAEKEKAEKEKKAKEQEEAKRKAIEASKRPASFGVDRNKSPAKSATVVSVVIKEERAKSVTKDERPGSRPKSPDKKEEVKHLEVVHETVVVVASSSVGHTKLEKDRWYVEGYDGATHTDPIVVKVDSPKESVYVGKCVGGVVIKVEGKCKSLQVNSCQDVGLVCETVVATVEILNSQKCQVQTIGTVNLIQLDNCERCKLFLSKESLDVDCKVFTARASNTLIYTPTDDGEDMLEMALPEQFISCLNDDGGTIRHEIVMPEAILS